VGVGVGIGLCPSDIDCEDNEHVDAEDAHVENIEACASLIDALVVTKVKTAGVETIKY